MITLLETALEYAGRNWPVIPLHSPTTGGCSCRRSPCHSQGKHPRIRDWQKRAATDSGQIRRWWEEFPEANIGIATGGLSRLLVLDIDHKRGGCDAAKSLEKQFGRLPETLTARTGFGLHYYLQHPAGVILRNQVGKLADGLDVRATGGLIVAPPSLHANGRTYTWVDEKIPLAAAPGWLIGLLESSPGAASRGEHVIAVGRRNDSLFRFGCSLRSCGMSSEEIVPMLEAKNRYECCPPLGDDEIHYIAKSVSEYPPGPNGSKLRGLMDDQPIEVNPLFMMPLNVQELCASRSLQLMTDYQRSWALMLRCEAWRGRGFLPNKPDELPKLARVSSTEQWERDKGPVLAEFAEGEIAGEHVLVHPAVRKLYQAKARDYAKKMIAGAKGVEQRLRRSAVNHMDDLMVKEQEQEQEQELT